MKDLEVHQNFSWDSAYLTLLQGDKLVLESLFPRIHQMRKLRRRLSHELGVTGDEDGVSPPPAKPQKTSGAGHAPTAAAGAPTPGVPSPPPGVVGSHAGGIVVATPAQPALEASEDEAETPEGEGEEEPDDE